MGNRSMEIPGVRRIGFLSRPWEGNCNDCTPERLAHLGITAATTCSVLTPSGDWESRSWEGLQPGHIVRCVGDEVFPADVVLLHSSAPEQTVVDTSCLDGNKEWQQKQVVPIGVDFDAGSCNLAEQLQKAGVIEVSDPDSDLDHTSVGTFVPAEGSTAHAAGVARRHFIPQGAVLVYTEWAIGVVVYTGTDTKLSLHGGAAAME